MTRQPSRHLERGHFAFMRAIAQGLDERASWDRYLQVEGDAADVRTVRRTIDWIRDAFAAAAKREARPGTARLILLDPGRAPKAHDPLLRQGVGGPSPLRVPTLEEFAAEQGMDDFPAAEQLLAYAAAFPAVPAGQGALDARNVARRASRRARLVERQLEALRWLEDLVAQEPELKDSVEAWLHPLLARRLVQAGLPTLQALLLRMNGVGSRWWLHVPGIGATKAQRIADWLRAHEASLGQGLGAHTCMARTTVPRTMLDAVVLPATALRPFEKFVVPAGLDGSTGGGRLAPGDCSIPAANDYQAIQAWLRAQRPHADGAALSATQRAYRKEVERLLLWSVLVRSRALSALTRDDMAAYQAFLAAPPDDWCGPRHHQRWSPLWRPLEGPLAPSARRHAMKVLGSLFGFWRRHRYVRADFLAQAIVEPPSQPPFAPDRVLSFAQWDGLNAALDGLPDDECNRRLARAVRWLYATGIRLGELTRVVCADIRHADTGWSLTVRGQGARQRVLPLPEYLVLEFERELARQGFEPSAAAAANQRIGLMSRFASTGMLPSVWSASGIYQAIKLFLSDVADDMEAADPAQAEQLRRASTHWLRHAHAAHALAGRDDVAPRPIQDVRHQLGHASRSTTAHYVRAAIASS